MIDPQKKKIALVDPISGGHHVMYFKEYIKVLLELGYDILIFSPDATVLQAMVETEMKNYERRVQIFKMEKFFRKAPTASSAVRFLVNYCAEWKTVTDIRKKIKADGEVTLVFFLWLDSYINLFLSKTLFEWLFPLPWTGLYFHPQHLRAPISEKRKIVYKFFGVDAILKSKYCRSVAVLDEGIADTLGRELRKKIFILPDITDSSEPDMSWPVIAAIQAAAAGRKIISLVGSLEKRKGLISLLKAAQQAPIDKYFFVFAGKIAEGSFTKEDLEFIGNTIKSKPGNCYFFLERIPSESAFNAVVQMSDVIYAVYELFYHSSNLLTKGALFKKPILVGEGFCMAERVRKYAIGLTVESAPAKILEAVATVLSWPVEQYHFDQYVEAHGEKSFKQALSSAVAYGG